MIMKHDGLDLPDDPEFDHYVIEAGYLIGEAREVKPDMEGISFAYVKLWGLEEFAEYGTIENRNLILKKKLRSYLDGEGLNGEKRI